MSRVHAIGIGSVALIALAVTVGIALLLRANRPAGEPMPDPNGYDDLLRAAAMAPRDSPTMEWTDDELRDYVDRHAEALRIARVGLRKECRVRLEGTRGFMFGHFEETWAMRRLGYLFMAEGMLAQREGRIADAIRSYRECFTLGVQASRGGVVDDWMMMHSSERSASVGIAEMRPSFSAEQAKETARWLENAMSLPEPLESFIDRDDDLARKRRTVAEDLMAGASGLARERSNILHRMDRRGRALARLLLADLAIAARRGETGALPEKLEDLVPDLLSAVPLDPYTEAPLVYRPAGEKYVLYSAGPNGRDDGGVRATLAQSSDGSGDLFLDAFLDGPRVPTPSPRTSP